MTADTRTTVADGTRIGALWAANLPGPLTRWDRVPDRADAGRKGRSRFQALLGMVASLVSPSVIVPPWSAGFFFHPSQ